MDKQIINLHEVCSEEGLKTLKGFKLIKVTDGEDDDLSFEFIGPYGEKAIFYISNDRSLFYSNELLEK